METNQRNTNHMEYLEGMEQLQSDIFDRVLAARESYQPESYTSQDSAVLCICLPPFIFPITVKITVYTVDSTAKTRFTE